MRAPRLFPARRPLPTGFTLIEVLVACAVLALILAFTLGTISSSSEIWRRATSRIEAFQGARIAFDLMTRRIGQATLNTRWEYDPPQTGSSPSPPTRYVRQSDLHFLAGPGLAGSSQAIFFQTPLGKTDDVTGHGGLNGLLNACGYFVDFRPDQVPAGLGLVPESRFRLMQWLQPTEDLGVFTQASAAWMAQAGNSTVDAVAIADNVIALIVWPRLADEEPIPAGWQPSFAYDSRVAFSAGQPQPPQSHQLPPIVEVSMVAVDEAACRRLGARLESSLTGALNGLFEPLPPSLTDNVQARARIQADLDTLEQRLRDLGVPCRVFSSAIPIQEAKWTKD